jgi:hypothetical protein
VTGTTPAREARLAFIVGHRKSGSTWLLNLLSLHPDLRGVAETHVFGLSRREPDPAVRTAKLFSRTPWSEGGSRRFLRYRALRLAAPALAPIKPALRLRADERPATLLDLPLSDQRALRRELRAVADPADYVRRFFRHLDGRLRPRAYLLEKTPSNALYADFIQEVFPGAPMIAIHRDGRDVVVSDRFFTRDYGGERRPFDFAASAQRWKKQMEAHLRAAARYPLFACSYERLLADGRAVARDLFAYLGLPADDRLLDDVLERSSFRFHAGRDPGQEDRKRFYRKGIVGDWRNHFSAEDTRVFREVAGDMLVRLGYESDVRW